MPKGGVPKGDVKFRSFGGVDTEAYAAVREVVAGLERASPPRRTLLVWLVDGVVITLGGGYGFGAFDWSDPETPTILVAGRPPILDDHRGWIEKVIPETIAH